MSLETFILIFAVTVLGSSYGILFGGGAFIILPTLFLLGFEPKIAVATNLVAALAQLVTGSITFGHYKKINFTVVKKAIPSYMLGAGIGALILTNLEGGFIKKAVSIAIIVFAIIGILNGKRPTHSEKKVSLWRQIVGSIVLFFNGIYQTSITAGAGTVATFTLIYLYGLGLKKAIGTKQLIHISSVSIAAIVLISQGLINWILIIPLVLGRIIGALIGTGIMVKTKSRILFYVFNAIVLLLALKILLF